MAECEQDCYSALANAASCSHPKTGAREDLHFVETLCDAVVAS